MGFGKDGNSTGIALGGTLAGAYALCGIAFWLAPAQVEALGTVMFHGLEISARPLDAGTFGFGIAAWAVVGYALGWLFASFRACGAGKDDCCKEKEGVGRKEAGHGCCGGT